MTRVCGTERTPEPSATQQGGKHQTQTVADGAEGGWPQRIHISKSWGGGGGSGLNC